MHARVRTKTFSIVSVASREYGMRSYVFVTFGAFEVCNAYCGTSRVNGHVLAWTRTFDPAAQKGRSSGSLG